MSGRDAAPRSGASDALGAARLRWRTDQGRAGELPIAGAELTIGRAVECGLVIDSGLISRVHCRLVRDDAGWSIEDTGSANGTFVNGYQIRTRRPLAAGDRIRLGLQPVVLEAELVIEAAPAPATGDAEVELDRWRAHATELQRALDEAREREASTSRAAARTREEIDGLHAELVQTRDRLATADESVASLRAALAAAEQRLAALAAEHQGAVSELRSQVEETRHDVRKAVVERERLDAALAAERARAGRAESNCGDAIARVAELESEIDQLRAVLADAVARGAS